MSLWSHDYIQPEEVERRAQAIQSMANSEPFRWLIEEAARAAHLDWENGKTVEAREAAYQQMQAIRALDTQIQKVVDRGIAAGRELRGR